jgi:Tfp pilus assembly protein PilN
MRAVNLLPKDAVRARRTSPDPALLVGVMGFAVIAAVLFSMYMSASQKADSNHDNVAAKQEELSSLAPPPKYAPVKVQLAADESARTSALADALSYRVPWDYIMGQIVLAVPTGVKLTYVHATAPRSPVTAKLASLSATPTDLELHGWTLAQESVALFMERLSVLPPLANVTLQTSAINSGSVPPYYQFTIVAEVKAPGEAPS